jgi:anthranilate synthase component 1
MRRHDSVSPEQEVFAALVCEADGPVLVPFQRTLPLDGRSPVALYIAFRSPVGYLLESIEGPERCARYSFISTTPRLTVNLYEERTDLDGEPEAVAIAETCQGSTVLDRLRALVAGFPMADVPAPRLAAGFVGSFAYELAGAIHRHSPAGPKGIQEGPIARLHLSGDMLVIDHVADTCTIVTAPIVIPGMKCESIYAEAIARLDSLVAQYHAVGAGEPPAPSRRADEQARTPDQERTGFENAVGVARKHVRSGECLQIVVSRRIDRSFAGDPLTVYRALRTRRPGPYLYLLEETDRAIVGASPEMLLRVEGSKVTTVPIAGTRPRGTTPDDDERLAEELLADEKERSEHLMLVDLARSDLGRCCTVGSVNVEEFMTVERFSHVQHLVSTVTGTLRPDRDRIDALAACFPAGTVSGAPRLRAMELIEELEAAPRGVYAGAVGYLDCVGNMDLAIAIRTAVIRDGIASVQVGAGIVADSIPEREFVETQCKADGMLAALAAAEGEGP